MRDKKSVVLLIALLVCIGNTDAFAFDPNGHYFYSFDVFTNNGDWGTGGSEYGDPLLDLSVEVYDGFEAANFKFHNNSDPSLGTSITDIYFDDGTLFGISSITNQPGTSFDKPAIPSELPGNTLLDPDFITSSPNQSFSADSDSPPYHNGVQAGEWVLITFQLQPGGTLEDVINEINDQTIRVGIHVQGFTDDSSESAVNVPEPATLLLLGLGGLALRRKRKA